MSKIAMALLLLGIAVCRWQRLEAKPFFLLPKFVAITTSAPSIDIRSSSSLSSTYSTSSSYGGDFNPLTDIISKKIRFITNLLSILRGGGGGNIGGGCGFGVSFNVPATTSRPKTTEEPDAVFPPESSTSTNVPINSEKVPTTTTSTEKPVVDKEVEVTTAAAGDVSNERESTTSTENSLVDKDIQATTATSDLVHNDKDSTTRATESVGDKGVDETTATSDLEKGPTTASTDNGNLVLHSSVAPISFENKSTRATTEKSIEDAATEPTASAIPINTESASTTSKPTSVVSAATEDATIATDFSINIQPTVVPQKPAVIKETTKNGFDITNSIYSTKDSVGLVGGIKHDSVKVNGGVGFITDGGKDDTQKGEPMPVRGDIEETASVVKAGEEYGYQYNAGSIAEIENEILGTNVSNTYLPIA